MAESDPHGLLARARDAIRMAQAAGADGAFARARRSRSVEYDYRDGTLEKVQEATSMSLALSLYVDGRYSTHSTTSLVREERVDAFISEAVALTKALQPDVFTKSSLMVGLGETQEELFEAIGLLRDAGVDFLTLGQYLRPTANHAPVREYVTPERFKELEVEARALGFLYVASGPLVRSSYKAGEFFATRLIRGRRAAARRADA